MGSNRRPPNSSSTPQNSIATQQQQQQQQQQPQAQMGMAFPQNSVPFSNPNEQAMAIPNQNGFFNHPNQLLQLQNSLLGMAQLAMLNPAQFNMGAFAAQQNCVPNMNQFPGQFGNMAQNPGQVNSARPPGQQFYGQNFPRLPQAQMNQAAGLPNGQFGFQNTMPNMNQFVPVMGQNYNMFGGANQQAQAMGPQNPSFFPNPQFGQVNQNQQNLVPPGLDVNALLAAAAQLLQGNQSASPPANSCTVQPQQNQNLPPSTFTGTQGNPVANGQTSTNWQNSLNAQTNTNWKNSPNGRTNDWKNSPNGKFTRNQKGEIPQAGYQKSQFHHMKNTNRNFNEQKGQGMKNGRAGKFDFRSTTNPIREQNRSLALTYTEQEIQQWREERKKNHPSKNNAEKKLTDKPLDPTVIDMDAKLRRERLKEVLAKQAELGVEVAEIPSHYLSDSEKQFPEKEDGRGPFNKRGRFQNKQDKRGRGRNNRKDRYAKKQKLEDNDPSNIPSSTKKPTLLEKLLSADIKRDKRNLLQVFRFIAMNSYFKHWPEEPLKFPRVLVKENGCDVEVGTEKGLSAGQEETMSEKIGYNVEGGQDIDDDDDDENENENENEEDINDDGVDSDGDGKGKGKGSDEEEGEIIDF